jgi:hypothetical protein
MPPLRHHAPPIGYGGELEPIYPPATERSRSPLSEGITQEKINEHKTANHSNRLFSDDFIVNEPGNFRLWARADIQADIDAYANPYI